MTCRALTGGNTRQRQRYHRSITDHRARHRKVTRLVQVALGTAEPEVGAIDVQDDGDADGL